MNKGMLEAYHFNLEDKIHTNTYFVQRKINRYPGSPGSKFLSPNIEGSLREVLALKILDASIIKEFDYGENIQYYLVGINYENVVYIFAIDFQVCILVNFFEPDEYYPEDESICVYDVDNELIEQCSKEMKYQDESLLFINAYRPFLQYIEASGLPVSIERNGGFWRDVKNWYNENESLRYYSHIQLNRLVIIYDSLPEKEISEIDMLNGPVQQFATEWWMGRAFI